MPWCQTPSLQNRETINFCRLSPSVSGALLWQPSKGTWRQKNLPGNGRSGPRTIVGSGLENNLSALEGVVGASRNGVFRRKAMFMYYLFCFPKWKVTQGEDLQLCWRLWEELGAVHRIQTKQNQKSKTKKGHNS